MPPFLFKTIKHVSLSSKISHTQVRSSSFLSRILASITPLRYDRKTEKDKIVACHDLHPVNLLSPPKGDCERYTYDALPTKASMIRLVEVLPGEVDRICCKVHTVDLNDLPRAATEGGRPMSFEALSYTWDAQALQEYVWCDNKVLPVTRNLYTAMQQLRKPSTSRLMWVDAICINQVDVAERSRQVALMRVIYHRAVRVIAWLGPDDQFTQKAFCLIQSIFTNTVSADGNFKADAGTIWNQHAMERMGLPRFPSSEWEALARLFERPYFRRLWVVQELVVSSEATTWCGPFSVQWAHIEYVAKLVLSSGWLRAFQEVYGVKVRPSFVQTIGNCKIHFHETQGGPGMGLANLLCSTRRFQTTDPRDKIIALIGLTRDAKKYEATMTDYSKSIADLYLDTTGQLITADQSLLLLSSVEDISYRRLHELPSWVPDYSVWQRSSILGFPLRHSKYSAGGGTSASVRWTPGSRSLMVDGICHDQIEAVSANSLENSPIAQSFLLQCLDLAGPLLRRGYISIDAVWRTLIGNTGGDTYPAPERYRLHFRNYLSRLSARNQAYLKTLARDEDVHTLLAMETNDLKVANSQNYQASIAYTAPYRKFFTTARGTTGLGPRSMRPGDSICIFSGGLVPFILRKDGARHRLIGEAYVHGIMDGQAIWKNTTFEEFRIW